MESQVFDISQSSVFAAQSQATQDRVAQLTNASDTNKAKLRETAEDFEAVFISQMLKPMFETIPTDSMMGGGPAESVYRGLMVDEMSKSLSKSGGIGIADSVYRELLKLQEA
jgi:peptidoglycan hydrolase FlgJ